MLKDVAQPTPAPEEVVEYPTSDGRPMGESDVHRDQMVDLIHALKVRYEAEHDVYVTGNLLLFYEEGIRWRHVSPDAMVVHGVPQGRREQYKLWEEGKAPSVVFEITSRSTRSEDLGTKKGLYAYLGIPEYVLFDPREEYLKPRLRIYRLEDDEYRLLDPEEAFLASVGLNVVVLDGALRLQDPESGRLLPTVAETDARARESEARAQESEARAQASEARAREAEQELAKLRARLPHVDPD